MTSAHSFGRYRVTGTLGSGAMGEVYAAVDEVLGREVAVKTLRGNRSGLAARMLDIRFRQEARAIAALHHPGIVQVFDIDLAAEPPYLVMERVAGPALKDRLREGAFTASELVVLGIQVARALAAAHAAGIVHRDVKPANILSAGTEAWKLADFGVAHVPDSSLTLTGQFVGSPAYAPPEALVRGQLGPAGDIYGLGATLYEAAAGRWPRLESTSSALFAPLPPVSELAPALPPAIAAVIDRAVSLEPDHRPTAAELADSLAGAASLPGLAEPADAVEPAPQPSHTLADPGSRLPAAPAGAATGSLGARAVAPVSLPALPHRAVRWKPWAIGGAVALAIALFATTRGGPAPSAQLAPATTGPRDERPTEIQVTPPSGMDARQTRDWNKIIEELERGHLDGARRKLEEFEDHHGETDETRALRSQLDALGSDVPRGPEGPRGRGRGKKHHDD
ncbi:MAG TPA: serine/threonine-protein kinase [Kofleriaceae bacterium]|nr:serine/threonine-protein kinase [Kofleriaceae bacterium]